MRIQDLADAYRMPRITVSIIVKNKDVIKSTNIAKGVKSLINKDYWKGTLLPNNNIYLLHPSQHLRSKHSTLLSKIK